MKSILGRKAAAGVTALLAAVGLFGAGVSPASALDTHPIFLNFAAGDTLGQAAAPAGAFEGGEDAIGVSTHLSHNSLKITKKATGQPWSGVNLLLPSAGNTYRLADATNTTVTLDWWNPDSAPSPVMLKMETAAQPSWQGGPWVAKAVEAAPGLNHLSFDMSTGTGWDPNVSYDVMAIFGNWNADDTGYTGAVAFSPNTDQVYEVDNISVNGATSADAQAADVAPRVATSTVLTFEDSDTVGALAAGDASDVKPQGGFEGLTTSIDAAPAGGNGGKALKMVKNTGSATYAGVNLVKFAADTRVTDGTNKVITLNYYSPKAGSTVRLEVNPWPNAIGVNVTAVQGWQTLTFDFTGVAGWSADTEYNIITLFPDFDKAGDASVYYADNVAFNGATTPAIPAPAVKPAARVAASVLGTAKVGKTLTASRGSWTGTATITYSYRWYRCTVVASRAASAAPTSGAKCTFISGGTAATHKVVTADVGKYLRVLVTARNSAGSTLSLSKTSAKAIK